MPPIDQLQRLPPYHLDLSHGRASSRLACSSKCLRRRLVVSTSPTNQRHHQRRQRLARRSPSAQPGQLRADQQVLFAQAGIVGLSDLLAPSLDEFRLADFKASQRLRTVPPEDLTVEGWWEQAHTLAEE